MTELQSHHQCKSYHRRIVLESLLGLLLLARVCVGTTIETSHKPMHSRSKGTYKPDTPPPGSPRSSSPVATEVLQSWPPTDYRVAYVDDLVERSLGTAFSDYRIDNYSRFITLPKQTVMYAVGDGKKLVKLDSASLMLLDMYSLPQKANRKSGCRNYWSCQQSTDISLLALMPSEEMVWFCYAHYLHRERRLINIAETGCMVPTISSLTEPLLQWENPEFTSFDPRQPAIVFNAGDGYTYIAGVTPNHVQILRTRMPDWNGKLNWSGILTLDKSRNLITEPSEFLLTFETEDSVYFVVREQSLQRSTGSRRASWDPDTKSYLTSVDVSCLVRICKNDPGGLAQSGADKFATFAKAELNCQAADGSGQRFAFVYLTSAYWDAERQYLFAAFTTERLAPVGSALCIYSKESIEAAFAGPILSQALNGSPAGGKQSISMPNEFPDICKRFNSKNVTVEELSIGRRLSLSFPNRYNPIEPAYQRALLIQSGQVWRQISVYSLSGLPAPVHPGKSLHTTIVLLASENVILRLAIYEGLTTPGERNPPTTSVATGPVICKLNEIRLGSNWQVLQRLPISATKGNGQKNSRNPGMTTVNIMEHLMHVEDSQTDSDVEVIRQIEITQNRLVILTNRQILQLPLADCSLYVTYEDCIQSKEPHCGWSWPDGLCRDGYPADLSANDNATSSASWYNTFSPSVGRSTSVLRDARPGSLCPPDLHPVNTRDREWSDWYTCRWYSSLNGEAEAQVFDGAQEAGQGRRRSLGRCRCRMCLGGTRCKLGSQEVINCTSSDRNWLPWSTWSRCDPETGVQTRHRSCRHNAVCVGSSREQRSCSPPAFWSESLSLARGLSHSKRMNNRYHALRMQEDTFTLNHILLVALFCILIGSLVTTFVLFAYWQYCAGPSFTSLFHYPGRATGPTKHRNKTRANSLIGHVTADASPWSHFPITDNNVWISDVASTSSRYPLTNSSCKIPEVISCRSTCGRPRVQKLCTDCSKSPSNSGPPTTSTLLKTSFTFEGLETESSASPTPSSHPVAPNHQSMRTAQLSILSSGTMRPASLDATDSP